MISPFVGCQIVAQRVSADQRFCHRGDSRRCSESLAPQPHGSRFVLDPVPA
jgi:hypothetical protein